LGEEMLPPFDPEYLDRLVTGYYAARSWDPQTGSLAPERLAELTGEK